MNQRLQQLDSAVYPFTSIASLRQVLRRLKIRWLRVKRRKASIEEKEHLVRWRNHYLEKIQEYQEKGYQIVYTDETWCWAGDTVKYGWADLFIDKYPQLVRADPALHRGIDELTKNGRLLILHAVTEEGLLPGCARYINTSGASEDYKGDMNTAKFVAWFRDALCKNRAIKQGKCVIVLDNASIHNAKSERIPTWGKLDEKRDFCKKYGLPYEGKTGKELSLFLKQLKEENGDRYEKFIIDEIAREYNIEVLRTPPYHCWLNPIELVWSHVKSTVRKLNFAATKHNLANIQKIVDDAFSRLTADDIRGFFSKVRKEEDAYRRSDNLVKSLASSEYECERYALDSDHSYDADSEEW
jgi:hypothetical protein